MYLYLYLRYISKLRLLANSCLYLLRVAIEGHLDDDSIHADVRVQSVDPLHQLHLRHRPGDPNVVDCDADLVARLPLHVDVDVGVASVTDLDDRQSRTMTLNEVDNKVSTYI